MIKFAALLESEETPAPPTGDAMLITGQSGVLSSMRVATDAGWRGVADLQLGDYLLTFDDGFQPVRDIQRDMLDPSAGGALSAEYATVHVEAGVLGNQTAFDLMPDQGVLIESRSDTSAARDPFMVIPARALLSLSGVHLQSAVEPLYMTTLSFANDAVIYSSAGVRLFCPSPVDMLLAGDPDAGLYHILSAAAAGALLAAETQLRLGYDAEEVSWVA